MTSIRSTVLACIGLFAFAVSSTAATLKLKADLKASSEVPRNDSKGTGSVTIIFDEASKKLMWNGSYSNLTGPATAAHFHGPAQRGKIAPAIIPIFMGAGAKSPFEGSAVLTDEQTGWLKSGQLYVNVHTNAHLFFLCEDCSLA